MAVTRRGALLLGLAPLLAAAEKKRDKRPAGRRVRVVELDVRRVPEDRTISVEGKILNCGERPLNGLSLVFHVIAPSGEEVSRQRGLIDEDPLGPGEESEFHWQMKDQARAVEVQVTCTDKGDREIPVDNAGPFTIE